MKTLELLRTMENISNSLEKRASEAVKEGMFDYALGLSESVYEIKAIIDLKRKVK